MGNYLDSVVDVLDARKRLVVFSIENDAEPLFSGYVYEIYSNTLLRAEHRVKDFKVCMSTVTILID